MRFICSSLATDTISTHLFSMGRFRGLSSSEHGCHGTYTRLQVLHGNSRLHGGTRSCRLRRDAPLAVVPDRGALQRIRSMPGQRLQPRQQGIRRRRLCEHVYPCLRVCQLALGVPHRRLCRRSSVCRSSDVLFQRLKACGVRVVCVRHGLPCRSQLALQHTALRVGVCQLLGAVGLGSLQKVLEVGHGSVVVGTLRCVFRGQLVDA